jgi:hypothetical protein
LLGHIADSQTERDAKKIVNFVIDCVSGKGQSTFTAYNDAGWVPISQITRQFQRIPKWQRDQLISSLIGGGYLKQSKISIAGHGPDAVVYRPFLMDFG